MSNKKNIIFICTGNAHLYKKLIFSDEVGTAEDSRWTMQNESSNLLYFRKYNQYGNAVTGTGYMGDSNVDQIDFDFELPASYNLNHMNRFGWFSHNWQLKEDTIPFFMAFCVTSSESMPAPSSFILIP